MECLKRISKSVLHLLQTNVDCRKNDWLLYYEVCKEVSDIDTNLPFGELVCKYGSKLPSFESVTRTRRKVLEKYPHLKDDYVQALRNDRQQTFIEYSKE